MRADGANTASSIAPSSLAGATSKSSTTTSAGPAAASRVPASSGCLQRSATAVSALCSRSRSRQAAWLEQRRSHRRRPRPVRRRHRASRLRAAACNDLRRPCRRCARDRDRAKQLGWSNVEVIDDDLGRSGGGIARPGFERLLATICDGRVGAVLAIEASRLARNGRDWHTLIEFCGLVGTLIVGEDGIYDPRHPNDRLLLGMKGTMSELELSMFRQRSQEALKQKARRGALVLGVAAGYVKIGRDRIEQNPDKRVQDALQLVFTKFAELQSARQVHIWLREEGIELPVKSRRGEAHGVVWRLPAYNIVHNILTNPIYSGAYAFGRTTSRVSVEGGRKHIRRGVQKPMAEWDVLIKDHHAAYITWDEFEHNLKVIANNATGMSSALARGAARKGELLLPGLLRCGHCGRKLHVHYSGKIGRYNCYGARTNHGAARCISISGLSIDAAISNEVLRVLKPLGIEAALKAIKAQSSTMTAAERQLELSLQQARYEAAHARRQY